MTEINNLDINFVVSKLIQIMDDTEYIKSALDSLLNLQTSSIPGDIGSQGKALAIGNIVEAREETNRQILRFLEKIYDDLNAKENINKER